MSGAVWAAVIPLWTPCRPCVAFLCAAERLAEAQQQGKEAALPVGAKADRLAGLSGGAERHAAAAPALP